MCWIISTMSSELRFQKVICQSYNLYIKYLYNLPTAWPSHQFRIVEYLNLPKPEKSTSIRQLL